MIRNSTRINGRVYSISHFFSDFFYFMLVASAHDIPDNNTLSSFPKTIENIISILESESEVAINWLKYNHMIVNRSKF